MSESWLRDRLNELNLPDEEQAGERTWRVARAAYAERERVTRRGRFMRPALVLAVPAALVAAALSSPGQAVLDSVREVIGIERAEPALFSLPAQGMLVVASPEGGAWVVHSDGSKRRLGDYRDAAWSPLGRFLVVAGGNELAALDPNGDVRWTLARPHVRFPRWAGSATDTRIAYLTRSRLHVVAGDGTGDVDAGLPAAAPVAPAWRPAAPGGRLLLAYASTRGRVSVYSPGEGTLRFRTPPGPVPSKLEWSSDGRLLLVLAPKSLRIYDLAGRVVARDAPSDAGRNADATFLPGTSELVVVRVHGRQTDVIRLGSRQLLFRTTGELRQVAASPDGRWLLLSWPAADQWVFVHAQGGRQVRAASNITRQFGGAFPVVGGWCCATGS